MFVAYDSDINETQKDILGALFDQPGMRIYDFVEIALNTHIFHVDVMVKDEERYQRVIFHEINDVLKFCQTFDIESCKISLQSKRKDSENYSIKRLSAILKGRTVDDRDVYIFQFSDQKREVSDFFEGTLDELSNVEYVWHER